MPRLLLIARNPALAFGLGAASDDIIDVRPSLVGRLTVTPDMADLVVIEQERPDDALATLDLLRERGLLAPALLVASSRPEWAAFDVSSRASVAVLDPPVTPERLGQSVTRTTSLGPVADASAPPQADGAAPESPADVVDVPAEATVDRRPLRFLSPPRSSRAPVRLTTKDG